MIEAQSLLRTQKASQYLQQLCKHFGHKVKVDFDAQAGTILFLQGKAVLKATETCLKFEAQAEDREGLERIKWILQDHIARFAFRENPDRLEWSD